MIKLVLFDIEQTLIQTDTNFEEVREKLKILFVNKGLSKDFYFKPVLAKINEAVDILYKNHLIKNPNILKNKALNIIKNAEVNSVKSSSLIKGAKEVLEYFHNKNIMIGIFSRTSITAINKHISKYNLGPFQIIVGRETVSNPKPAAEGIIYAMNKLKVKPQQIIVVGDHPYDIEAGKIVGTFTVGLLGGIGSRDSLTNNGADIVLNSISELPRYFENFLNPKMS